MEEYCKIVLSQQGREKIIIKGYLMVKNKNRDYLFYWNCEKKVLYKYNGHVSTILINRQWLNYAPKTSRAAVSIANFILKGK